MNGPALAVMAREPVPGKVKTRLEPHLTPEQCASLYRAFLLDTVELAASTSSYTPFLAYTPRSAKHFFVGLLPPGMGLLSQPSGNLGQKMHGVMQKLAAAGHAPVVIIGSDLPLIRPPTLEEALQRLRKYDMCLGPALDGGYYLIGLREPREAVFQGIPWSTPLVLRATVEKARRAGLSLGFVEERADIDTFADLARLQRDIARLRDTPGAKVPLHTEEWLTRSGDIRPQELH